MATLEERMALLEARVDALEVKTARIEEVAVAGHREAAQARLWHRHNVQLLRAVRETQAEHTETLAEHTRQLAEHGRILAEHGRVLSEHGRVLAEHTQRLNEIDGKLGMITLGVHDIQLMLTHLIERDGGGAEPEAG